MIGTGNSGVVYLNRRIRNRTYGGVGGRRGRLLLLPDQVSQYMPLKPYGKTFKDRVGRWVLPCDEPGK